MYINKYISSFNNLNNSCLTHVIKGKNENQKKNDHLHSIIHIVFSIFNVSFRLE